MGRGLLPREELGLQLSFAPPRTLGAFALDSVGRRGLRCPQGTVATPGTGAERRAPEREEVGVPEGQARAGTELVARGPKSK